MEFLQYNLQLGTIRQQQKNISKKININNKIKNKNTSKLFALEPKPN